MKARVIIVASMLMVAGCGSSPTTHFYTLEPVPGGQSAVRADVPIVVGHVDLPGELDRQSLVTHGGGTTIKVSDQDRWAAPLDELVRRALTGDLRTRLPSATVLAPGDPVPKNARTLTVNVRRFMADAAGRVTLDADWVVQGHGAPAASRQASVQVAANGDSADAITVAMSQALGQLADQVAVAL
ncbi:MAG TPA: PqiC family protein [Acetobacteraceae bacterium]|nr:PqiC family protein [Acetobacteraceae bacterium]